MKLFASTCCIAIAQAGKKCDLSSEQNPIEMRTIENRGRTKYNKSLKYAINGDIGGIKKWGETPYLEENTSFSQIKVKCKGKNILDKNGKKAKSLYDGYLTITAKECFKGSVLEDIQKLCQPKPSTCYSKDLPSYYGANALGDCSKESYQNRESCSMKQCDNDKKAHKVKCDCSSGECQWLVKPAKTWENASSFVYQQSTCIDCSMIACAEVYEPVCGSDGKTYSNSCKLEAAQCQDGSIQMDYKGECDPCKGIMCTAQYDPVCGSDGKTYSNECKLGVAQCYDSSVEVKHEGKCDPCRKICSSEYKPVCGSDGKTYSNECKFEIALCKDDSLKMKDGACVKGKACALPDVENGYWICPKGALAEEGYVNSAKGCTIACNDGYHPNKIDKPATVKCQKKIFGGGKPLPVCIPAGCGEIHNKKENEDGYYGITTKFNVYIDANGNEVEKNKHGLYPLETENKPQCPDTDSLADGYSQSNVYDSFYGAVKCVRGKSFNTNPTFIWAFEHGGAEQDVDGCMSNQKCLAFASNPNINQGYQNCNGWHAGSSPCACNGASKEAVEKKLVYWHSWGKK